MRLLARLLLAATPVLILLGGVPFANRIEPEVAGLPFLLAWLIFWVLAIPLFLLAAERLREKT